MPARKTTRRKEVVEADGTTDVTEETVDVPSLPEGQSVRYVMPDSSINPAVLVDVGGAAPRIVVQTDSGLQEYSLIQYIGGAQAPTFSANQEPGTWHWPAQGE